MPDGAGLTDPDVQHQGRLGHRATAALLFLAFDLSYILCPYWRAPVPAAGQTVLLVATAVLGIWWAHLAAGEHSFSWARIDAIALLLIGACVLALNARALLVGVPWRGDEAFHLGRSLWLLRGVLGKLLVPLVITLIVTASAFLVPARLGRSWLLPLLFALLVALQGVWLFVYRPFPPIPLTTMGIARYPSFVSWLSAAPWIAVFPWWRPFEPFSGRFVEAIFRLTPFVASVLLCWHGFRAVRARSIAAGLCLALAIATMPLVFYYSSIFYLEMPAVLLMAVVLGGGDAVLTLEPRELRRSNAWLALVLIGFVKETTLPFLAAFVALRLLARARALRPGVTWRAAAAELLVCFCAVFPLATYMLLRSLWGVERTLTPAFGQLVRLDLWRTALHSYAEQFGALALLALAGVAIVAYRRRWLHAAFLVGAFAADVALHFIDKPWWVGYSRFNLFLVPSVVAAAATAVQAIAGRRATLASILLVLIAAANLCWSPVNWDGTKKPGWGQYDLDTSEHYYPYREAIRDINRRHASDRILFAGMYYYYPVALYLDKGIRFGCSTDEAHRTRYPITTTDDPTLLTQLLARAAQDGFDVVLLQLYGQTVPELPALPPGFHQERVFENDAHRLVLYARAR
jgi:hypothetical protein